MWEGATPLCRAGIFNYAIVSASRYSSIGL